MVKCFRPTIITMVICGSTLTLVLIAAYVYLAYYIKNTRSQDLDAARDQQLIGVENLIRAYDGLPPLPGGPPPPELKNYAFDHIAYSNRYPELKPLGTSETALKKHWITKGLKAGYNGTANENCGKFDPIKYGLLHSDLTGLTSAKLLKHYLETGVKENRTYCSE